MNGEMNMGGISMSGPSLGGRMQACARKVVALALLGAALVGATAAQAQEVKVPRSFTVDFEKLPLGPIAGNVRLEDGMEMSGMGEVKTNANGGHYFETGEGYRSLSVYDKNGANTFAEVVSLDVAIAAPVMFDGQAAKAYVVASAGFTKFPVVNMRWVPAPTEGGLTFLHLDNMMLGGDWGEPYGELHPDTTEIFAYACKNADCDGFASSGRWCGSIDCLSWYGVPIVPAKLAIDNMTVTVTHVSGVPEPSTYAMLLVGLVGVGFAGRRRS